MEAINHIKVLLFGQGKPEKLSIPVDFQLYPAECELTLDTLVNKLSGYSSDEMMIILDQIHHLELDLQSVSLLESFRLMDCDVLCGAQPDFKMNSPLQYFYWKHYPRPSIHYNYLNAGVLIGKVGSFLKIIDEVKNHFFYCYQECGFQDLLSRYYADIYLGATSSKLKLKLDHQQALIACTSYSFMKTLKTGWVHQHLVRRNERLLASKEGKSGNHLLNVSKYKNRYRQHLTKTLPQIIVSEKQTNNHKPISRLDQIKVHWRSAKEALFVVKVNKWKLDRATIFRHLPNQSQEMTKAMAMILERLENRKPLSFAHYNDGELTFIRDFQSGNHHEEWFGRKQQQYNPDLAQRLLAAMQFKKEGYFVGVPCSIDHPKLRKEADALVGDYDFKIQAMSIHHNLFYMPRIINTLRGREVYFFTNEHQDLSFFSHFGVEVSPERVINVPFRNSYLEYDRYKDMRFPDDSVVILTCGMLAKILTKVWFENHDKLTVLALGASLDDHLQKQRSGFELFPTENPITGNIKKYRYFLFGYKKPCKECFDFSQ